jgi:glutamate 5-kinase
VLPRLLQGESIGTLLTSTALPLDARKQWLADHLQVGGKVILDDGAVRALRLEGKSLLPIGVIKVEGEFQRGAVIAILDGTGKDIARGLVNYNADEARRIARHASNEIEF